MANPEGRPRKFVRSEIIKYLTEVVPTCSAEEAAAHFGCSPAHIRAVAKLEGVRKEWVREFERRLERLESFR